MKKLIRIKLINWHLFLNQTLEIKGNSLLTGENGAGKSTFLDAIQYVLTVGKAKFNTAANNKAKRNLEGYIRCKLGIENKTYLRNGDVTTHIALEFYDDVRKQGVIIGVVAEINKQSRISEHFYILEDSEIIDELFISEGLILNYRNFKKFLINNGTNFSYFDTKEKTRKAFLKVLGISNKKYIELIPKALAFKPIDELNKFVFDFLLNEKKISLDELRQNVKSYKEFEELIAILKEKETYLDEIKSLYTDLQNLGNTLVILNQLKEYSKYQQLILDKKCLEKDINNLGKIIESIENEKNNIYGKINKLKNESEQLRLQLQSEDYYKYYQELERKISSYEKEVNKKLNIINDLNEVVKNETSLLEYICQNISKDILIINEFSIGTIIDEEKMINYIDKIKDLYNSTLEQLFKETIELRNEEQEINDNLVSVKNEIESLKKNKPYFDKHLLKLKSAIEEEIKIKMHHDYQVKTLCELIEINDESWRKAIEGYLNTRRFDLIIEPNYFDIAFKVYEEIKEEENIYGFGIVNTKAIKKYQDTNINSLASKIKSTNNWSRNYVNLVLNQVICCESVSELKKYHKAITKSCMVYQNYTVRNINKAIYSKPFIGINALKIQLEDSLTEKAVLEEKKASIQKLIEENRFFIEKIKANQLDYIKQNIKHVNELDNLNKELVSLKQKLDNYKINSYFKKIENKLLNQEEEMNKLELEKNNYLIKIGKYSNEIEVKKESLSILEKKINSNDIEIDKIVIEYYEDLLKRYKSIDNVFKYCQEEMKISESGIKDKKVKILIKMNQFKIKFNSSFNTTLE